MEVLRNLQLVEVNSAVRCPIWTPENPFLWRFSHSLTDVVGGGHVGQELADCGGQVGQPKGTREPTEASQMQLVEVMLLVTCSSHI